jgi:hypothetical protein
MVAHFITSNDVERSRRFYTEVVGGEIAFRFGDLTYVRLANAFIIINVGGGPTDDKPTVILEAPSNPDYSPTARCICPSCDLTYSYVSRTIRSRMGSSMSPSRLTYKQTRLVVCSAGRLPVLSL